MSNDRIDEIIREHINISYKTNLEHIQRTRKAMEQYGKECHADGMREGHSHGIAWAEKYLPELIKLRELAKAQKEYINCVHVELGTPCLGDAEQLLEQIKELES